MTASTPDPRITADHLSDAEYRARTDAVLASIEASIDRWLQDGIVDIDSQRTGGLLELSFPNRTQIIVNTQPPLQELWMAAQAGGFHYRSCAGCWLDTRSGADFFDALSACASSQAGLSLRFAAP